MKIFDTIAHEVRKEVMASGRGRLVESSIRIESHGTLEGQDRGVWGARFAYDTCEGRRSWADAFYTEDGTRVSEVFWVGGYRA